MEQMLRNPEVTKRMGERARDFAGERFSVARHVDAVEAVYRAAIGETQRVATT
jgi:glycosyltransferase involved in cell wall biosynthesis